MAFTPRNRDLEMVMRRIDKDLAIFLGTANGGKEKDDVLLHESDDSRGSAEKLDSMLVRKRSLSAGSRRSTSRPGTPTRRGQPNLPAKSKSSRPSTPTSEATLPSTTPSVARTLTPTRAIVCSMPIDSKSVSRSTTPNRKPLASITSDRSLSGAKTRPTTVKKPVPSRGIFPSVKSRPSNHSETIGLSNVPQLNSRASMPKRPSSASKERASAPAAQTTSTLQASEFKPRGKSCSPSRIRASDGTMLSRSRGHYNGSDDANPGLIGTQMVERVERVVNTRKLAPPKHEEKHLSKNSKKSSQESSGFGRSLSKRSLDMAMRHMIDGNGLIGIDEQLSVGVVCSGF